MPVFVLPWMTVQAGAPTVTSAVISVIHDNLGDGRGNAWMTVSGSVLSVDSQHGILLLDHGPLETAPRGTVECVFDNKRNLRGLRRGDWIMALARTDRHPWILRNPRIIREPSRATPKIAAVQSHPEPA